MHTSVCTFARAKAFSGSFFFNVSVTTEIYTLEQLTDALLAVGKEAGVC